MKFSFTANPHVYFGPGQISRLPELISRFGQTALIITGARSFVNSAHWKNLSDALGAKPMTLLQASIEAEPTPAMVDGIVQKYRKKHIDVVVAVGGGSVLDGGKAVSAMMMKKKPVIEYLEGVGNRSHDGEKLPFIAVPTTSGTGSEATKNAVICQVGKNGFKKSLRHDNLIPDIALIDPELTLECPPDITAACGMDALTQLIESLVSTQASAMTDALASGALTVLGDSLPAVVANSPEDIELRSRISYASYISGLTLANAGLGLVHGFAGVIGGLFNIPHGIVCGTLLAETTRQNIETLIQTDPHGVALTKYEAAAHLLDPSIHPGSTIQGARHLVELLDHWCSIMDIPRLGEFGVEKPDISRIIEKAGQKNNPAELSREQLRKILERRV